MIRNSSPCPTKAPDLYIEAPYGPTSRAAGPKKYPTCPSWPEDDQSVRCTLWQIVMLCGTAKVVGQHRRRPAERNQEGSMKPTFLAIAALTLGSATIVSAAPPPASPAPRATPATPATPPRSTIPQQPPPPPSPTPPRAQRPATPPASPTPAPPPPGAQASTENYPACSRTVTDNCLERTPGAGRTATRNTRARTPQRRATPRAAARPATPAAAPRTQ